MEEGIVKTRAKVVKDKHFRLFSSQTKAKLDQLMFLKDLVPGTVVSAFT